MTYVEKGKIILIPISPEKCVDKPYLFRSAGLYKIISVQKNRIVIQMVGSDETSEKDKFTGFYQPVAFFPNMEEEGRYIPFNPEDYLWCDQFIPRNGFGSFPVSDNVLQAHLKYQQELVYIKIQDGVAFRV